MYTITFNNSGGELDSRKALTPELAAREAVEMIQNVGALYAGDRIVIEGEEDDE